MRAAAAAKNEGKQSVKSVMLLLSNVGSLSNLHLQHQSCQGARIRSMPGHLLSPPALRQGSRARELREAANAWDRQHLAALGLAWAAAGGRGAGRGGLGCNAILCLTDTCW